MRYGATNLDTTIVNNAETDYILSANAVFASGADLLQSFIVNAPTITINSFSNIQDKVLFIQVPSTEPAFTKWSESGNPFQQNLNIDQSFIGTELWFKTMLNGNTLYITRIQTRFTGSIILSR